ncbi:DUF1194 domain-containing protein [Tropicibacter naphthalenivorans]|uniref:von Willebrand factor type A domain protein n=1 Tax=Tropicibacter naphthalenivorans TaxID=441103 RepID=A0A0P1GBC8_9RHOB|nr:DUF1194 domain-containing protein [Tropicibacter naphthalenivorans]CUH78574.1 hypothetical protein TRN7648_02045 [Tropicibacter naphthalenivorans]SMC80951.1 Protein of unknown function [Tropicibacter naphthalenivorans]
MRRGGVKIFENFCKTFGKVLALGLAVGGTFGGGAQATCRQALALGLDVSGSVDAREYRLQLDGVAGALDDPEVRAALFQMPGAPVALAIYEWSGPAAQRVLVDWTVISDPAGLAQVIARLRSARRVEGPPSTALGSAKAFGAMMLAQQSGCWRRVLDISGDGESNTGPRPLDVRPPGIDINGLVIGSAGEAGDLGALSAYYRAYVIQGPDAFVETAHGFEAYEAAMVRKLKRELQVLTLSSR